MPYMFTQNLQFSIFYVIIRINNVKINISICNNKGKSKWQTKEAK